MKSDKKPLKDKLNGLRFNTWLIFTLFAGGILIMLWFLQLNLLPPYYRAAKTGSVKSIADSVELMLISDQSLGNLYQTATENSLCIQLVDGFGNISNFNGIGSGCYIDKSIKNNSGEFDFDEMKTNIFQSSQDEYNFLVNYGSEMIVYGRIIDAHLGRYVLLINAAVTPEKAGFDLIQNQFVALTILVLLFATIASIILARKISSPFIAMTSSAKRLAQRDFDVKFDAKGISFNEFNDLAESLNYATAELKKVDQLRLDLIANVSHDIKTPLTMILAYAEMIQDFSKDDKELLLEHLGVISAEAKYLDELVDNMMELSMLESGSIGLNLSEFSLNKLVREIIDLFKAQDQSIKFNSNSIYIVEADRVKISQVIYNFLNNAIKYCKDSEIEIKFSQIDNVVRLSVIDKGIGISEADLENVWDRYYRIDKNFYRDQEGSGLGLSIARGIILAHNATYGVISTEGEGSEFYFELKFKKILNKD
ncbi:MAG TPA: HAMP domain-containing sensor histidine kinase [Erysipelotrichaceae bacterium]|nr:HAMP domain-containing sensor histidine kinase [Erysipelotrichaceae bacterium]